MHPNGQLPAYEWNFCDVNPPVHAWAALRVWQIDRAQRLERGEPPDDDFLERIFHKLLLNFSWWVNRKDEEGNNVFEGGFLGWTTSACSTGPSRCPVPGRLEQSDGTAWMAMYCLNLLEMAMVLARHDPTYEDVALKFFEHFAYIARAAHGSRGCGTTRTASSTTSSASTTAGPSPSGSCRWSGSSPLSR